MRCVHCPGPGVPSVYAHLTLTWFSGTSLLWNVMGEEEVHCFKSCARRQCWYKSRYVCIFVLTHRAHLCAVSVLVPLQCTWADAGEGSWHSAWLQTHCHGCRMGYHHSNNPCTMNCVQCSAVSIHTGQWTYNESTEGNVWNSWSPAISLLVLDIIIEGHS